MSNLFIKLLPLLLPIAAYLLWWRLTRSKALAQGQPPPELAKGPWVWLVSAGLVLVLIGGRVTDPVAGPPPIRLLLVVPASLVVGVLRIDVVVACLAHRAIETIDTH